MKNFLVILILVTTYTVGGAQPIFDLDPGLPYSPENYQEIEEQRDIDLQYKLNTVIKNNPNWYKLTKAKRMAVGLVDISDEKNIKYAAVNGRHMMYAASLPKIAVLLSAMEALEDGCLEMTPEVENDLRIMISQSNNYATTRVIERIGLKMIENTMCSKKYGFYNEDIGGGIWVGKKYAKSDIRIGDPLKNISHAATVEQVCRFYTMLAYGKLVNKGLNSEIMRFMVNPEINHKFVKTLNKIAPSAKVYRKSGSWRNYHADSALVFGEGDRKYILVALIEDPTGSTICSELVYAAEKALNIKDKKSVLAEKVSHSNVMPAGSMPDGIIERQD